MIKLFGHPVSTCTRKVLMTLGETETPYELTVVDLMTGEHKKEPHVARQPFGQVPVLEDDGFRLYESRAICRYLSGKANDRLVPQDRRQSALMDQWISVEQSNFSPAAMKFIFQHVFKRPQEQAALDAAAGMIDTTYATLSKALGSGSGFLAGDKLSLADIGFMPYIEYLQVTPQKATLEKYPEVAAWWKRISERPSWGRAVGRG